MRPAQGPIIDGTTPLNAAGLNPIFSGIYDDIETLNQTVGNFESGIIVSDTGFTGCTKGQVVAYDGVRHSYIPAQPTWSIDADGVAAPDAAAYIAGIVYTEPDDSGRAQLLTTGILTDVNLVPSGRPGTYYLGANGTLVATPPRGSLTIYCGYKTSSGAFVLQPATPEYSEHRHTVYTLNDGTWTSTAITDEGTGTTTYTAVYDDTDDPTCRQILASSPLTSITVVFGDRVVARSAVSLTAENKLQLEGLSSEPSAGDVTLYGTNSMVSDVSLVQSIAAAQGNNIVRVTKAYGTVYIDTNFVGETNDIFGSCVAGISRSGVKTAPVVNTLSSGIGIKVAKISAGKLEVNATGVASKYLDFQTINANNVLIGSAATDNLVTFPANVAASLVGIARVPASDEPRDFEVFVWIAGNTEGASLTCDVSVQPPPAPGGSTVPPTLPQATLTIDSVPANNIAEFTTAGEFSAAGDSLVKVVIAANPTAPIRINAIGIKLIEPQAE